MEVQSSTGRGARRRFTPTSESTIRRELDATAREAQSKIEKLRLATDRHISVEILHLFVLDLLGRDSPAAKIFVTKSQQE